MDQKTPTWLSEIQERSWEPELFISGGAIFSLYQLTDFLRHQGFIMVQRTGYYEPVLISNLLIAALNALMLGFVIHLILRGFWVASVTLSYVFPKGIQMDKIHYQPLYKDNVRKVSGTIDWVISLETICSLIFTLSFFFMMIIMGILITLLIIIPHSSLKATWGEQGFYYLQILSKIFIGLGLVYLIDFLTLGFIKKQKFLEKVYYPVYILFSLLTLAPLYRTTYYTLVSNIKPWIVILVATVYLLFALALTQVNQSSADAIYNVRKFLNLTSEKHIYDPRYYETFRPEGELVEHLSIQSDIVKDSFLRLFIVHQKVIENLMSSDCGQKAKTQEAMMACYDEFYRIYIDGEYIKNLKWRQYAHPQTGEQGIIAFVPLQEITKEEHHLKVVLNITSKTDLEKLQKFGMESATYAEVPFWKGE